MFFNFFKRNKRIKREDLQNKNLSPHELGILGEKMAVQFLKSNKYKILETNYVIGDYEVDIIAEHADYIVFVEVKTRRNIRYGMPSEAVDRVKRQKYRVAANIYLSHKGLLDRFVRFDVVEVLDGEPRLITNAF